MEPVCVECAPVGGAGAWVEGASAWSLGQGRAWDALAGAAEGVVALHSAKVWAGLGRWTLIGACPLARVRGSAAAPQGSRWEEGGWAPLPVPSEPFAAVEALLAPARSWAAGAAAGLPFRGGAMGLFGYACRARVEALRHDVARHGEPDLWWGLYDTFWAYDALQGRAWAVSWGVPGWGEAPDPGLARARAEGLARAVAEAGASGGEGASISLSLRPEWSEEEYAAACGRVLEGIASGECYQGCLTFALRGPRPAGVSARSLWAALCAAQPAPFAALVAAGEPVALASASPERFLQVRGDIARVRPMKGTRPRGVDLAEDARLRAALVASEKDQAENLMIVDLMRNDLGRACALGSVEVPELFTIEEHPTVFQMTSTVEGRLRPGVSALAAARACFPPGSMTGAPKVQAMRLLESLEASPRGWYSGVVGYLSGCGDADLSVVIRAAQVSAREVAWHVGGGVVADSTAQGEWEEALGKYTAAWRSA
jgi:para-aminobenzoate synthetase component 1